MKLSVPLYETMTKIDHLGYQVRVWSKPPNADMPRTAGDPTLITHLREWAVTKNETQCTIHTDPQLIHDALVALPEVTAFEILDGRGNGFVCYPEWP